MFNIKDRDQNQQTVKGTWEQTKMFREQVERHPSRRLETRICVPAQFLAGQPHI